MAITQVIDSKERLGAQDFGGYPSIRSHPFFESVDFETLYMTTPPCPSNYTDTTDSQTSASSLTEFQDAEPGLGGQQLTRLLGLQLNDDNVTDIPIPARLSRLLGLQSDQENVTVAQTSPSPSSNSTSSASQPSKRTVVSFPANEQQLLTRLQHQQENLAQWHQLVERKLILKQGLVDKRKVPIDCSLYFFFMTDSCKLFFFVLLGPILPAQDAAADRRTQYLLRRPVKHGSQRPDPVWCDAQDRGEEL